MDVINNKLDLPSKLKGERRRTFRQMSIALMSEPKPIAEIPGKPLLKKDAKKGLLNESSNLSGSASQLLLRSMVSFATKNSIAVKKPAQVFPTAEEEQSSDNIKTLIDSVRSSLEKIGESPDRCLPILNSIVLPDVDSSRQLGNVAPEIKSNLLASLLVQYVNAITHECKLAIVIDDCQWMDSASWQMLTAVVAKCKEVYLVLASDRSDDYRALYLENIRKMKASFTLDLDIANDKVFNQSSLNNIFRFGKSISIDDLKSLKLKYGGKTEFMS